MRTWKRNCIATGLLLAPTLAMLGFLLFGRGAPATPETLATAPGTNAPKPIARQPYTPKVTANVVPAPEDMDQQEEEIEQQPAVDEDSAAIDNAAFEYDRAVERRRAQRMQERWSEGEPDAEWSAAMRQFMQKQFVDNGTKGQLATADCRDTMCRIVAEFSTMNDLVGINLIVPPENLELYLDAQSVTKVPSGAVALTYYVTPPGVRVKHITENTIQ